jgi:pimeloyl-[acyl-carrier protein] methyl ester esterase
MSLHVEIRGRGPDLVLLHGWALHGGMWGPWLEQLAEHARLHILDLPGHGERMGRGCTSRGAGAPYIQGAARPAVLGWSLGGMIAGTHASTCASCRRCCSCDDTGFVTETAGLGRRAVLIFSQGSRPTSAGSWNPLPARGKRRWTCACCGAAREPRRPTCALETGLSILRVSDLRDALSRIALPALVISGEHDRLTPADAGRELAIALPAARFRVVERSAHAPFLSHAPEVLEEVRGFLSRHQARAAIADEPA